MPNKKLFALTMIFAGFGVVVGFVLIGVVKSRKSTAGLKIETNPESLVFVDNIQIGSTPIDKIFPPGEILLKLIPNSSSSALTAYQTKVRLTDQTFTIVRRDFAGSEAESSGDIVSLQPQPGKAASITAVSAGSELASVVLDGQPQGFTPLLATVPAGDHQVTFTAPGFASRTINIKAIDGYKLNLLVKLSGGPVEPTPVLANTTTAPSPTPVRPYVIIKDTPTGFLNVRSKPSPSGDKIGSLKPKELYPFLSQQDDWYLIQAELEATSSGWISKTYATLYP